MYSSKPQSSSGVDDAGASAKWIVMGRFASRASLKAGAKIDMSPTAGSPQRSMPTTPLKRYFRARETTSRAVGRVLRRSMERMRFVFIFWVVVVEWAVMQERIVEM